MVLQVFFLTYRRIFGSFLLGQCCPVPAADRVLVGGTHKQLRQCCVSSSYMWFVCIVSCVCFSAQALPLFVALASSGGRTSFRRLGDEQLEKLIQSVTGTDLETVRLSANEAADMFCALHRVSYRNPALMFKLTRHICDHVELLAAAQLPKVARVLGRGDVHEEYVLLHAIARRVGAAAEVPEGSAGHLENAQAAALLVNVCSKWEIFDEEFLTVAAAALRAGTAQLAVGQICEVIYSVSAFLTRDAMPLEDFCSELKQRIHEMNEIDTVRLLRGLQKLRYHDEALMEAVATIILEAKARLQPISLCNLVSVLAYFGTSDELVMALLKTAIANKLPAMSVQHILTALCRLQGRVSGERLEVQVRKLCAHISNCSFTPVQAMSSLAAMAKLQHRDLAVASVLASILSGGQSYWRWAKSPHFFRSVAVKVPFEQQRCRRLLEASGVCLNCECVQTTSTQAQQPDSDQQLETLRVWKALTV